MGIYFRLFFFNQDDFGFKQGSGFFKGLFVFRGLQGVLFYKQVLMPTNQERGSTFVKTKKRANLSEHPFNK
jgi:hypothetical protein